tara:strand:+ start:129 stop:494 length:366 start_codon:yes stop_codon:yes gene_type:complete
MSTKKKKTQRKTLKKELEFKDDGQEYAQVVKIEGHGRCRVKCSDGVTRLGVIRGAMRKKVWIKLDNYVLVGLRDFQDNKCDIIGKYSDEDVRNLRAYGELPTQETFEQEETRPLPFDFDDI